MSQLLEGFRVFETEAHALLERFEDAHVSRVVNLGAVLSQLEGLNSRQERMFRQALTCARSGVHLAAHVMAWAALADLFEEKLASDGLVKVHREYPAWSKHQTLEDLRESVPEAQLLDAGKKVGLLSKGMHKTLQGQLHQRNQAAHPTGFDPGINETLGYIEGLIKATRTLQAKSV